MYSYTIEYDIKRIRFNIVKINVINDAKTGKILNHNWEVDIDVSI